MINRNNFFFILFLYSSLNFFSCKFDEIKPVTSTGEMQVTADQDLTPVIEAAIKEFERLNPQAKIDLKFAPTKNAVAELVNGQSKFIMIARDFTREEKEIINQHKIEIDSFKYAIDGIGFIVNKKNPVKRITSDDLNKIFSGEYKQWTDIKIQDENQNREVAGFFQGNKNKIKVFIPRKNSSIYDYVKDSVLRNVDYINSAVMCSTSVQMLEEIRKDESAIGISNSVYLSTGNQDELDTSINILRVSQIRASGFQEDFVQFHQGLIYNGEYPYRRFVYIFTTQKGITLATGLIGFLTKIDGQKIALKYGLVPVTQPVRTIQIN